MSTEIGLLGDIHGDRAWLMESLRVFADWGIGTVIQVGDLGVWHGNETRDTFDKANRF